ncbi:hypothetical protein SK128_015088, partial [Halocaridina rubra]
TIPDIGVDVTVIDRRHLDLLSIPQSNLQPPSSTTTLTADGSELAPPPPSSFQATPQHKVRFCSTNIQVHEAVQGVLLSYAQCQELAIILPNLLKPIFEVKHVTRCSQLVLFATTYSMAAKKFFFFQKFKDVLVCKADLSIAQLKLMVGQPMRIHLKDDTVPFAIHTLKPFLLAFQNQFKEELDSGVQQGIIKPVGKSPWNWYHSRCCPKGLRCSYHGQPHTPQLSGVTVISPLSNPLCHSPQCRPVSTLYYHSGCLMRVLAHGIHQGRSTPHYFYHPIWTFQTLQKNQWLCGYW